LDFARRAWIVCRSVRGFRIGMLLSMLKSAPLNPSETDQIDSLGGVEKVGSSGRVKRNAI
jgi:hypothetical protein